MENKKSEMPVRSLTLYAIQTHPKDSFKVDEIYEQVKAENPDANRATVTNIISTDFQRIGLVQRTDPNLSRKGGVEYSITDLGRNQDYLDIPSINMGIEEVRRRQQKKMPEGVTDPGQVLPDREGGFTKLEGKIDMVELADAFLEYVAFLKNKVQKLADRISYEQSEHNKEIEALNLEIKGKNSEILELKKLVEKLHLSRRQKSNSFDLSELAQFRSSRNKS